MNKRHYEHTLPNIRGSLSNTYFGARGKSGLHARLLRGIRPEGVEIARKTVRFSLATCPFFPVGLLKNECGAWLKIRWVKGFLFASLSLSASGSPKEKEVRPKIGVVGVATGG